ncbi:MAG: hypothetical protein MJB14_12490 [Spirochaetes bacterium]|nr:hypothetical protein [Spirochaetota bacterium]
MEDIMIVDEDSPQKQASRDLCDDISTHNIPTKLEDLEFQIDRLRQRWGEFTYLIGQRLKYIKEKKLYQTNNYRDFKTYVSLALKMSENNAYYYIAIYEYFTEDQTKKAGSKLKLIIPLLNRIKRDRSIPENEKEDRLHNIKNELYFKVYNKSYREAEKAIGEIKSKYFSTLNQITPPKKIVVKKDRVIIYEDDPETQAELLKMINEFYQ